MARQTRPFRLAIACCLMAAQACSGEPRVLPNVTIIVTSNDIALRAIDRLELEITPTSAGERFEPQSARAFEDGGTTTEVTPSGSFRNVYTRQLVLARGTPVANGMRFPIWIVPTTAAAMSRTMTAPVMVVRVFGSRGVLLGQTSQPLDWPPTPGPTPVAVSVTCAGGGIEDLCSAPRD